jgi:hypothetical protein
MQLVAKFFYRLKRSSGLDHYIRMAEKQKISDLGNNEIPP